MNIQLLLLPFFIAFTLASLSILGHSRKIIAVFFSFVIPFIVFVLFNEGHEVLYRYELSRMITIMFSFKTNVLSLFFGLLLSLSASIALFFISKQRLSEHFLTQFYAFFYLLLGGILLMLFSGDFITFIAGGEIISYCSYFLFSLSTRNKEYALKRYLIISILSDIALFISALIFYSHSGSFLFSRNELLFQEFQITLQAGLLLLLSFAFFARPVSFLLAPKMLKLFINRSLPLSLFLLIVLIEIPLYELLRFSFFFIFERFDSHHIIVQIYPYWLIILGGAMLCLGYARVYRNPQTPLIIPLIALSESAYPVIALSSLSGNLLASFALLLFSQLLSLILLYIFWFQNSFQGDKNIPLRSIFAFIALLSLAGFPPFLGFGSKIVLLESLLELKLLSIALFVALSYLVGLWILIRHSRLFSYKNPQKAPNILAMIIFLLLLFANLFPLVQSKIINTIFQEISWIANLCNATIFRFLVSFIIPPLSVLSLITLGKMVWDTIKSHH